MFHLARCPRNLFAVCANYASQVKESLKKHFVECTKYDVSLHNFITRIKTLGLAIGMPWNDVTYIPAVYIPEMCGVGVMCSSGTSKW